jgi:hypothetical protein
MRSLQNPGSSVKGKEKVEYRKKVKHMKKFDPPRLHKCIKLLIKKPGAPKMRDLGQKHLALRSIQSYDRTRSMSQIKGANMVNRTDFVAQEAAKIPTGSRKQRFKLATKMWKRRVADPASHTEWEDGVLVLAVKKSTAYHNEDKMAINKHTDNPSAELLKKQMRAGLSADAVTEAFGEAGGAILMKAAIQYGKSSRAAKEVCDESGSSEGAEGSDNEGEEGDEEEQPREKDDLVEPSEEETIDGKCKKLLQQKKKFESLKGV